MEQRRSEGRKGEQVESGNIEGGKMEGVIDRRLCGLKDKRMEGELRGKRNSCYWLICLSVPVWSCCSHQMV